MNTFDAKVIELKSLTDKIYLLTIEQKELAEDSRPGNFCNIKIGRNFPLLRRPFGVCDVKDEKVSFMFDVHGEGTKMLSELRTGEFINVLGPLGNGFDLEGEFETAVILAGGLGVAPFPYMVKSLEDKKVKAYIGGRNSDFVTDYGFDEVLFSTDDGSLGFKGNVLELFQNDISNLKGSFRVFTCGPKPMLKAVQKAALENKWDCQISTECAMACGFGICMGCSVESKHKDEYKLVCKDGPVFNAEDVVL